MTAPVHGVTAFGHFRAERLLFALADRQHPIPTNTEADKIVLDGRSAALAERQVVFVGAAGIGVPLNGDLDGNPAAHVISVSLQHRTLILTNR